jgi:hypothetical protein
METRWSSRGHVEARWKPEVQRPGQARGPEARGQRPGDGQVEARWRSKGQRNKETKGNRQMRPKNPPKNQIKFQKKKIIKIIPKISIKLKLK